MAKRTFRAALSGEGADARVRFFIDGSECDLDHYRAQYVKDHGELPVIPAGNGGAAVGLSPERVAAEAAERATATPAAAATDTADEDQDMRAMRALEATDAAAAAEPKE